MNSPLLMLDGPCQGSGESACSCRRADSNHAPIKLQNSTEHRARFDRSTGRTEFEIFLVAMGAMNEGRIDLKRELGVVAIWGVLALCLACGGPMLVFPGGKLSGEVVHEPIEDWSFVSEESFVDLETTPDDPYSVQLNFILRDGDLYIDPAEGRGWFEYLKTDPNVRVRFGDKIYPVTAVLVGRPGELEGFDPDRFIYRLDSRPE